MSGMDEWRALVEADLKGAPFEKRLVTKTLEGVAVQPLYAGSAVEGLAPPGVAPYTRGPRREGNAREGWRIWPEIAFPTAEENRRAAQAHLEGGAHGFVLRFDRCVRTGEPSLGTLDGFPRADEASLAALLQGLPLARLDLVLDAGAAVPVVLPALVAAVREAGGEPTRLGGALNMDPLGALARDGVLPFSLDTAYEHMAALAEAASGHSRPLRPFGVSGVPVHEAGGDAVQELAFTLAVGLAYLRALEGHGLAPELFAARTLVTHAIGRDVYMELAKLRAARGLWARVLGACGVAPEHSAVCLHARASRRTKTLRDPFVNVLRGTMDCFAAALGGAGSISLAELDEAAGLPEERGQRLARNTQLLLQRESALHRVVDPAGGSWYLESLTAELEKRAWSLLQEIESRGGALGVLASGWLAEEIARTREARAKLVATRREAITGVSEFPDVQEEKLDRRRPGASCEQRGGAVAEAARVRPLPRVRDAEPFEALREASDAELLRTGRRPRVFLANMGPIPQHRARAMFADNLFQAGGFDVIGDDGFLSPEAAIAAFRDAEAEGAVLCSTDATYPELVPPLAAGLKAAGARFVALAGRPGEHEAPWREAGVDLFVFMGCDVIAALGAALKAREVQR